MSVVATRCRSHGVSVVDLLSPKYLTEKGGGIPPESSIDVDQPTRSTFHFGSALSRTSRAHSESFCPRW